ncbi:MAG: hypothetical protein GY946_11435 [bacterium]|nr:hypothetical protein [bacterium]
MQAEELRIAAHPRSGWEAVDLGFAMARAWWRPIWGAWFLIVIPIAAALIVGLRGHPWWTLFILWWLRPVAGRIVLHVLGRALFSDPPSPVATLRALPEIFRNGVLASLTVARFSPTRCYALPILQLEGLQGDARRERTRILTRAELGPAASLHSICAHLNGALILALLVFTLWLAPEALAEQVFLLFQNWFDGDTTAGGLLVAFLYLIGTSVVEPFLIAGGFGLYVNRRMWLEGWDVEIALRRLTRRYEQRAPSRFVENARRNVGATLLLLTLFTSTPARAEPVCVPDDPSSAGACSGEVLAGEEFGRWEDVDRWMLREFEWDMDWDWPEWKFGDRFGAIVAGIAEVLLWVALAVGLILLVARVIRDPPWEDASGDPVSPITLFGLDLDPKALPADVIGAAREAFASGDATRAISLLYRGALVLLIERRELEIPASATEGDCARIVRTTSDMLLVDDFGALNDAWILSRYARAPIGAETFKDLCQRWAPRLLEPAS